jgi:hypothetical protein
MLFIFFMHEEYQVFFFFGGSFFLDPDLQTQFKPNPIRIHILEEQFLVIRSVCVVRLRYLFSCYGASKRGNNKSVRGEILQTIWAKNAPYIFRKKSVVLSLLPVLHHIFPKSQQSCGLF